MADEDPIAIFESTDVTLGAINFIPKNNIQMAFNTGVGGIFKLELEFENLIRYIEKTNTNQLNEKRIKKENI